jgi:ubiquitin C-terminal hydrolase
LDVEDKKNIIESMKLYMKDEKLEGDNKYYDGEEKVHVECVKKTSIFTLPNILIFHLKRFKYDYERSLYEKLNDRVEFPLTLNMFDFVHFEKEKNEIDKIDMEDKIEKNEIESNNEKFNYELTGVVVHRGSANSVNSMF